jgi:hypothetical protein
MKICRAIGSALIPLIRTIAKAPSPGGVAIAAIVSSSYMGMLHHNN